MLPLPTVLALLPKSTLAKGKRIHATPVHTLTLSGEGAGQASLRRKQRAEVVLGLPGGAVQLYNIRAARLVSSYAAPPDTKFLCPPSSVLLHPPGKHVGGDGRRRITVAAIQSNNGAASSAKFILWEEHLGDDVPLQDRVKSRQYNVDASGLVKIDISAGLSLEGVPMVCYIGVSDDGATKCWTSDFRTLVQSPPSSPGQPAEAAFLVHTGMARRGILKNREDITIAAMATGMQDLVFSVLVADSVEQERRSRTVTVRIQGVHINPSHQEDSANSSIRMEELAKITLPASAYFSEKTPRFMLHASSGRLFQQSKRHIAVYRLTGIAPKLDHEISFDEHVSSMVPISSGVVAAVTPSSVDLLSVKYKAMLASTRLQAPVVLTKESPVNVTNGLHHPEKTRIDLIYFCRSVNTLVAVRNNHELIAVSVESEAPVERPRKRFKHATLADAIGRGMHLNSQPASLDLSMGVTNKFGKISNPQPLVGNWQQTVSKLKQASLDRNSKAFDDIVADALNSDMVLSVIASPLNPHFVDSILTQIFKVDMYASSHRHQPHHATVSVRIWPKKTIDWLARHGCITLPRLELAHKRQASLSIVQSLEPYAILEAVSNFDQTLDTLQQLLRCGAPFSTNEIAVTIRTALRRIQQVESLAGRKLLTENVENSTLPDGTNPETEDDTGDRHARQVLRSALKRLERTPQPRLRTALAAELVPSELLALIDQLRISIASVGWLSHYTDAEKATPDEAESSSALPFALLNTTLDVLGAHAWLRGSKQPDSSATALPDPSETLSHMRAEVAAALECVEESAYLGGLLHETLLYARTVPKEPDAKLLQPAGQERSVGKDSAETTVARRDWRAARPVYVASAEDAAGVLPLGLRYSAPLELEKEQMRKVGAGGKLERRSMREVGHLKRMKVGRHVLERITF